MPKLSSVRKRKDLGNYNLGQNCWDIFVGIFKVLKNFHNQELTCKTLSVQ